MKPKRWRAKKLLAKLVLTVLAFLFGSAVAEVALRLAGYSAPEFYSIDQTRGYALRPGVEGWFQREGKAYIRINSDGLRDREHSITKPQNVIRIAVLGDSYAEAFSVAEEDAFWSVIENETGTTKGMIRACLPFPASELRPRRHRETPDQNF